MAIEFGSRKENFDNFKVYETTLAGRPFKVEMGKMCGLSNASALIRYGETCVMCNVVMSPKPREGVDFFPLNVEYEEKLYAAGRIPGSFMRREGRPGERAILTSRVVDRPMRPLFPKEMRNDVCITMTVMSLDPDCSPEIAGMIGASLVTAVSLANKNFIKRYCYYEQAGSYGQSRSDREGHWLSRSPGRSADRSHQRAERAPEEEP